MSDVDLAYLALLEKVLLKGRHKSNRTGVDTYSLFGEHIDIPVAWSNFPLLTTKKMSFKSIYAELLWFLRGYTDNAYLRMHNCTIWDEWATKEQCEARGTYEGDLGPVYGHQWRHFGPWREGGQPVVHDTREYDASPYYTRPVAPESTKWIPMEVVSQLLRNYNMWASVPACRAWEDTDRVVFDLSVQAGFREYMQDILLGRPARYALTYLGKNNETRNPTSVVFQPLYKPYHSPPVDQIDAAIQLLIHDPNSRRIVVSAWNPTDIPDMALPPCHASFQLCPNEHNGLDMVMNQRSADVFLGVPYNIASYALLLLLMAKAAGFDGPHRLRISFGDVHLYKNHVEQALTQLRRTPKLPAAVYQPDYTLLGKNPGLPYFHNLRVGSISVERYHCHPALKADVAV